MMSGLSEIIGVGVALGALVAVTSFISALFYRPVALRLGWLDVPSHRSLHTTPQVTSGGIVLLLPWSFVALLFLIHVKIELYLVGIWLVTVIALGAMGLIDDIRQLPIRIRVSFQTMVSLSTIVFVWPDLDYLSMSAVGIALFVFFVIASVWWLNLFNFMDGADGLAVGQALFMFFSFAVVFGFETLEFAADPFRQTTLFFLLITAISSLLVLSLFIYPPAKFFLGNAGSLILAQGLFVAGVSLLQLVDQVVLLSLLGGVFIWDSTTTLLLRVSRGKQITEAHTQHLYQRVIGLVQDKMLSAGASVRRARIVAHRTILFSYSAINVCVILPYVLIGLHERSEVMGFIGHIILALAALGAQVALRFANDVKE